MLMNCKSIENNLNCQSKKSDIIFKGFYFIFLPHQKASKTAGELKKGVFFHKKSPQKAGY